MASTSTGNVGSPSDEGLLNPTNLEVGTSAVVPDSAAKPTTDFTQEQYRELNEKYKKMHQDNGKTVTENTRLTAQVDTLTTEKGVVQATIWQKESGRTKGSCQDEMQERQ